MNKKTIILTYFILVVLVYIPDLITTIIGLSMGAVESNPIANSLFSVGLFGGCCLVFLFILFLAFMMFTIIELVYLIYKRWIGDDLRFYAILLSVALLIFFWQELQCIFNNINVIWSLKGG